VGGNSPNFGTFLAIFSFFYKFSWFETAVNVRRLLKLAKKFARWLNRAKTKFVSPALSNRQKRRCRDAKDKQVFCMAKSFLEAWKPPAITV
jgi:hypothetical protein